MSNVTQLHGTTPEQLTETILQGVQKQLEELKKNFEPRTPDEFLTRKQTAELLSISYGCLHNWNNQGILKPLKHGNRTYYSRKAIEETLYNSNAGE